MQSDDAMQPYLKSAATALMVYVHQDVFNRHSSSGKQSLVTDDVTSSVREERCCRVQYKIYLIKFNKTCH